MPNCWLAGNVCKFNEATALKDSFNEIGEPEQ